GSFAGTIAGVGRARKRRARRDCRTRKCQERQGRVAGVKCPFCGNLDDKVIDSREGRTGDTVRRRRECLKCERRFTTYERIDEIPFMVVKKDGRREPYDRDKIISGLMKACEKRPVSPSKIDAIANSIERNVQESRDREFPTKKIGELIMKKLKEIDHIEYVRLDSVYLEFNDVSEFMCVLKKL